MAEDFDLDNILESALEDFEEAEKKHPQAPLTSSSSSSPSPSLPSTSAQTSASSSATSSAAVPPFPFDPAAFFAQQQQGIGAEDGEEAMPPELMEGFNKLMAELYKAAAEEAATNHNNTDTNTEQQRQTSTESRPQQQQRGEGEEEGEEEEDSALKTEMEKSIERALEMLQQGNKGLEEQSGETNPEQLNDMFSKVMEQFESSPQFQDAMMSMMSELVSRDVLYEPMKDMNQKYPTWLQQNKDSISAEDLQRYTKQFEHVQRICAIYEQETVSDADTAQVVEIMHAMSELGAPPQAIVEELAPGLSFAEDGSPQMPGIETLLQGGGGEGGAEGKPPCLLM
ncbi:Peroxisome chaperone and import receptor [Balamuthia mandrillaris]